MASPIVSLFKKDTFLSATAAPHMCHLGSRGVLNREGYLYLPDCMASAQAAHVYHSRTLMSGGTHVNTHIHKEKPNEAKTLHSVAALHSSEFRKDLNFTSRPTKTESFKTRTDVTSHITEDCSRCTHTYILGPTTLRSHLLRIPGMPACCTLLMNTKMNLNRRSVRLYHNQSSSKDPSFKLEQSVSDQSRLSTDISNTHFHETTKLTHTDAQGRATMVDVVGKVSTCRTATASATVILGPTAFRLLRDNQLAKGDALTVAQLAGIMASKQTSALIPLCHPLSLDHTSVTFHLDNLRSATIVTARCCTTSRTGVEMEALMAVSVAALTIYDMCKAVSHDIVITDVKLVSKTGGKRDFHRHPA